MRIRTANLFIALILSVEFFAAWGASAVNFNATPSAISNAYQGAITLQISGLTNGETVVVQKYLDVNGDGIVDAGDILWQQFQLTDGQASVFTNGSTSVTNFNVPCDTDGAANGSITANLYPAVDFAQIIVGKYLFVLSSPVGHFSPMTNSFAVTNSPFPQSISGYVVNNGTNVPDAIVILFQPSSNSGHNPRGGAVANNSGFYSINASPGFYQLVASKSNFVANFDASPYATLNTGVSVVTNVPLMNATENISGQVVDENNASIGIAGYFLPLQSTNDLLAIALTDTNGNFSAGVVPGQWKISSNEQSLLYKGYMALQNSTHVDTTTGSVSSLQITLPKATAILYGFVTNASQTPLSGVAIGCSDNNNQYDSEGVTFTNGEYFAGAIGGGADQWQVQYSQNGPANYIYSQPSVDQNGGGTNLIVGQAVEINFTGIQATDLITGNVQYNGSPVAGVEVDANTTAAIAGANYNTYTDTDTNGNFTLNVANGDWNVGVNCNGGDNSLDNILGPGNYQCPDGTNIIIANNNGIANFVVQPAESDEIYGYLTDVYGNPVVGVNVYANDEMGDIFTTTTDGSGYYSFTVSDGDWDISVDCGELNGLGYQCVDDQFIYICCGENEEVDFTAQTSTQPFFAFTTLYSFSATSYNAANGLQTNSDGAEPQSGLVLSGNTLYGTAPFGGVNGNGTVYSVDINLTNIAVLYSFSAAPSDTLGLATNSDGANPIGGLVLSTNLYGTAEYGGANGAGTIFSINTNDASFSTVLNFSVPSTNDEDIYTNSDGGVPEDALISHGGTVYGTAGYGGTNGEGTVFAAMANGSGLSVLHTFTPLDAATQTTNSDGANPSAGLVGSHGALYGTTVGGGAWGYGVVFSVSPNGTNFSVLYTFTNGSDGAYPYGTLTVSGSTIYGTAEDGGNSGYGTVFSLQTNGTGFTVLYSFTDGNDGANPYAGLTLSSNTLYGTAQNGGNMNFGTVFSLNTNGNDFTALYSFKDGSDGAYPLGGVILSNNVLYGTTEAGGNGGNGTVYALTPSLPPDLAPIFFMAPTAVASSEPDPSITVEWGVTNDGASSATGQWYDTVWFSTDGMLDGNSVDIGDFPINETVSPGGTYFETNSVTLPMSASGNYTLFVQVNSGESLYESTYTNNVSLPVNGVFTIGASPDLAAISLVTPGNSVTLVTTSPQSPTIPAVSLVTNDGPGVATNTWGLWYDEIYVSTNTSISGAVNSQLVAVAYSAASPLDSGASYTLTNIVSLPQQSGTYYLIYEANAYFLQGYGYYYDLFETNTNNNIVVSAPVTVTYALQPPDLAALSVVPASNDVAFVTTSPQSPTIPVTSVVENVGPGIATNTFGYWYDSIYVSTNTSISGAVGSQLVPVAGSAASPLLPGGSYTLTNVVSLPQQSGTYYVIYQANTFFIDGYGYGYYDLYETNTSNNVAVSAPITVMYQVKPPDLAPVSAVPASNSVTFFPISPQSPTVPLVSVVTNLGPGVATNVWGFWYDEIYVSTNTSINGAVNSQYVGVSFSAASPLLPGGSYTQTNIVSLPEQSGTYYLIYQANTFFIDGYGYYYVYESNTLNNVLVSAPVTVNYQVHAPDLAPVSVVPASSSVTFSAACPESTTIPVVSVVTNVGPGVATNVWGFWYDTIYVSTNTSISGAVSSQLLGVDFSAAAPLLPGGSYTQTNIVALPQQSGTYYVIYQANSYFLDGYGYYDVYETDTNNNVLVSEPITLNYQLLQPDLAPLSFSAATNNAIYYLGSGQSPTVQTMWAVTNQGPGAAAGYWYDAVYISTNTTIAGAINAFDFGNYWSTNYGTEPLASGGLYKDTNVISLPQAPGIYYLILSVNDGQALCESDYTNNVSPPVAMSVSVLKSNPVLAWNPPTAITYGAALGAGQLDASANVPGSFAYNPANGKVFSAGTDTLSVVFTPSDTGDYNDATDSVSLVVLPAPLTVTVSNVSRPYGQSNPPLPVSLSGLQNNDNITATGACVATVSSTPGPYPITPVLSDPNNRLPNYSVVTNSGALTVLCPTITVAPASLPGPVADAPYSETLAASGGFSPYTFAVTSGTLPPGLNLAGSGLLSGTPAGASTNTFTVSAADKYECIGNQNFTLVTVAPPSITSQPQNLIVPLGSNAMFNVAVSGTAPFNYQWQLNGANLIDDGVIRGSGSNVLTISSAQIADSGDYQVIVTNDYGSVTSAIATLTVIIAPTITNQPQSQSVGVGGTAVFSVGVSGTVPFDYQWFSNNVALPGATGATLTLSDAQAGEVGPYSVRVSNLAGSATSASASLSVLNYCAGAQPSQSIYPMGSVVPITLQTFVCSSQTAVPNQLATIWISANGFVRSLPASTGATGSTTVDFMPLATEAGLYEVAASLPGQAIPGAQGSFTIVGVGLSTNNISARVIPGIADTNIITLTNLTSVELTGLSATVIGSTPDVNVQLKVPGTLSGNATGQLSCVLTAPGNTQAQDQFGVLLTTAQGTTNLISVTATVVPSVPQLSVAPSPLNASMVQGGQSLVNFWVANIGGATSGPVSVTLPQVSWLTQVTPQPIQPLAPGQSNQVTLALTPPSNLVLGPYTGNIELTSSNTAELTVPFTFDCVSTSVGALQVTVQDDFTDFSPGSPNVSNATITVSDFQTSEVVTSAVTDASGIVLFTNLTSAYYMVSVTAPDHNPFSATVLVSPDATNDVTAFLPLQLVDYTWMVTPTTIPDDYEFVLDATFATQVPWPVVTVNPAAIDLCDIQGDSTQVDLTITNSGLIAASGLNLYFGSHPDWLVQPLVNSLGTLLPQSNMIVPVTITRIGTTTGVPTQVPAQLSYHVPALNATNYTIPLYLYNADPKNCGSGPTPIPVPDPCLACAGGGGFGNGGGGGGGIAGPSYDLQLPQGALVEVTIQIDQTAVISRNAFHATLNLQNNAGSTVSNLQVTVTVYDASNNIANNLFGITPPVLSGLNAVNGTGVMANGASGQAMWTIVPATNAAPQVATQFSVGGSLSYTFNGEPVTVPFLPVPITVQPCPIFTVDYFLQRTIYSQDPFVTQYEPPIPFGLGIIVKNNGYGSASDFSITSGQPEIVSNASDLLISFQLIGSQIGTNESISPSFTLDFGDLGPQSSGVGLWYMTSSLDGQFVAFDASYQHIDDFGNTNTSLISGVNTYEMNHVVQLPFDNGSPDFLVNNTTNLGALPDVVFASDGSTSPVTSLSISNTVTSGTPSGSGGSVTVTITNTTVPSGWVYLEALDPSAGADPIVNVKRSDGGSLVVGPNVWQTPKRTDLVPAQPNYLVHIFDDNPTASYTITYGQPIGTPTNYTLAATQITPNSALLNADVYPNGADTQVYFEWGTTTNYGSSTESTYLNASQYLYTFQDVNQGLGGLLPDTVYHYQAVAINSDGTVFGGDATFQTLTNPVPVISQVTNQAIADGQSLVFTNHAVAATYPVTFTLGGSVPEGATISTNGVFRWTPTCEQGSGNYTITVLATDSSMPPLTSSMTFSVAVGECVQVALGSTLMQVGQTSSVPVTLITSIPLTNLTFTLSYPTNRFANWSISATNPAGSIGTFQILSPSNTLFTLTTTGSQVMEGPTVPGFISFSALPGPSAFIPLSINNISGTEANGNSVGNVSGSAGRVVVIGSQPLLEAWLSTNRNRMVTLYGNPGTSYEMQYITNLFDTNWQIASRVPMTNMVEMLPADAAFPQVFYRAASFSANPPLLEMSSFSKSNMVLLLYGQNGSNYAIVSGTNLLYPANWTPVAGLTLTNSFQLINAAVGTNRVQFFRAKRQ